MDMEGNRSSRVSEWKKMVTDRSMTRVLVVRVKGGSRSENAGMSSEKI